MTEHARLAALASYEILDTPPEDDFDDVARLASEICGTPIAVVNLIDAGRQFFKAEIGLGVRSTPLESSFCAKAILEEDFLLVPDATKDKRFDGNPLVVGEPGLRFYAGALLKTDEGHAIGTVCVLDFQPRTLTGTQERTLRVLARQVMKQLDLRRALAAKDEAAQLVREVDTRHRQILDSAVDYAIVTMNLHGNVTSWNIGAENVLGWSEAEMIGKPADVFFTAEDVAAGIPEREMSGAREEGRGNDERWHVRKDGSRFFALGEMMPLTSAAGDLVGYLKILRDRTRQREIEDRLRLTDERLQIALSASGVVGLWDWMVDTDLLHGDTNFARLYGLDEARTAAGLTMEQYQEFVVPDDLAALRTSIRDTFETGADFLVEYRLVVPGRPLRWVECRGRLIDGRDGKPERFSGTAVDVTERKRAEEETRRLAAVVEQSGDFIGVAGLDGRVAWVNAAGRRLVGLTDPESVRGTTVQDYFDPADWPGIAATVFPAVDADGHWQGELNFRHFVTGAPIPVVYDVIALRDAGGAVTAYATVTRDITERKKAEQRQDILNQELSHRLKNTLAMVQAIAAQSLRGVTEKDAVAAFNKRVHAIAAAHDVLLQQSWSEARIGEVVRAVLGRFEMGQRIECEGPDVSLGPRATLSLSMLLHELATNALKYGALSTEAGSVIVSWSLECLDGGAELALHWRERGGPPAAEPDRRGFGSRLIGMGLVGTGGCELRYLPHGFEAEFRAPLSQVQQS
jgi:PAS domain S-box-containing protein